MLKKRLRGDMVCKCLNSNETFDGRLQSSRKSIMRPKDSKLKLGKFRLEIRSIFLRVRAINHWYNLSRNGLGSYHMQPL